MTFEKKIASAFNLTGDNWLKHANPWSVWTRFVSLPFVIVAIWSRTWIGWYSIIPVALLIFWIKINPTLFKKPKNLDHWGSKAVIGEKYWSERGKNNQLKQHKIPVLILTILQIVGVIILFIGLWKLHIYLTIIGAITIYFAKMWFLDRMVWIFEDTKNTEMNERYS